jgi:predicted TIM-barrel fold metal-dependent hydrolase
MIIDADIHLIEPPDIFVDRLPAKYHKMAPDIQAHTEKQSSQTREWLAGGIGDNPVESLFDPVERAKVMSRYGINAGATFPNLALTGPEIYQQIPGADIGVQLAVVSAYNDWVLSWNERAPGRFISLVVLPYWDVKGAVRELERCAGLGSKGVVMSGYPQNHGCPLLADPHWNDLWRAAEANQQTVAFHASSGGIELQDQRTDLLGWGLWAVFTQGNEYLKNAISAVDIVTSGVLHRHPQLNFMFAECGIGWVPFVLEAMDAYWPVFEPWKTNPAVTPDLLPSDVFKRQCFASTMFERYNPSHPYQNAMFESDYPHPKCLIDNKIPEFLNRLTGMSQDELDAVLRKNAMRCWNLKPDDVISDEQMPTAAKAG